MMLQVLQTTMENNTEASPASVSVLYDFSLRIWINPVQNANSGSVGAQRCKKSSSSAWYMARLPPCCDVPSCDAQCAHVLAFPVRADPIGDDFNPVWLRCCLTGFEAARWAFPITPNAIQSRFTKPNLLLMENGLNSIMENPKNKCKIIIWFNDKIDLLLWATLEYKASKLKFTYILVICFFLAQSVYLEDKN